jgi:hypothetical protein
MQKITSQTGIVATKDALSRVDPGHHVAYENLAKTQSTLVSGHNELADKIPALEQKVAALESALNPFVSSMA